MKGGVRTMSKMIVDTWSFLGVYILSLFDTTSRQGGIMSKNKRYAPVSDEKGIMDDGFWLRKDLTGWFGWMQERPLAIQSRLRWPRTMRLLSIFFEESEFLTMIGMYHVTHRLEIRVHMTMMTTLIEWWHGERSAFLLLIGEMTVMLEDVWRIL